MLIECRSQENLVALICEADQGDDVWGILFKTFVDPFVTSETDAESKGTDDPSTPGGDPNAPKTKAYGDRENVAKGDIDDPKDSQRQYRGEYGIVGCTKRVGHRVSHGPE